MIRVALPHLATYITTILVVLGVFVALTATTHAQSNPSSGVGAPPLFTAPTTPTDNTTPPSARPDSVPGAPPLFTNDATTGDLQNTGLGTDDGSAVTNPDTTGSPTAGNDGKAPTNEAPAPDPLKAREGFVGILYSIMITIGGMVTWVGGNMLDLSVEVLVVGMGDLLSNNIGVGVNYLWEVVRDIFNILFIFSLIWIGLLTIIKADDSLVKKTLPGIIIAALLINFSLFITKGIVDFTNIAATQIYSAFDVPNNATIFTTPTTESGEGGEQFNSGQTRKDISVAFVQNMKLSTFAAQLNENRDGDPTSDWWYIGFGFLMMIVLIIAGFVFLAGAILLIYRFVTLVILMIFSPAMFLGLIFPQFGSWQTKWWRTLLSNAFVAPAYLFMLYLCLRVFTGLTATGTFASGYQANSVEDGNFSIFLYFGAMVGFLIGATRVATVMGAHGADSVVKVGGYGANSLRGWAVGAGKGIGRGAAGAGRGAAAMGYRKLPVVGGNAAKKRLNKLDKASARIAAGKGTLGDRYRVGAATLLGAGSIEDRRRTFEGRMAKQAFGGRSTKQATDDKKAYKQRAATGGSYVKLESAVAGGFDAKKDSEQYIAMADAVASASPTELAKLLKDSPKGGRQYQTIVENMSPGQLEKVTGLKDDDFNQAEKNALHTTRGKATAEALSAGASQGGRVKRALDKLKGNVGDGIKDASIDDLKVLDFQDDILKNAFYLQASQLDDMKKDSLFKGARFAAVKERHENELMKRIQNMASIVSSRKGDKNIANLPEKVLAAPEFTEYLIEQNKLDNSLLTHIANRDDLGGKTKANIGHAIIRAIGGEEGLENPDFNPSLKRFFEAGPGIKMRRIT